MEPDFKEFKLHISKARGKKTFQITNSYDNKQIWRYLKKTKSFLTPVTEREFGIIVKTLNGYLAERLLSGLDARFPKGMGKLELRKYKYTLEFRNDKLYTNKRINWGKTLKWWYEDEEAFR